MVAKQKAGRERSSLELRIAERQEANRKARATKITPEDVARRFEERRTVKATRAAAKPAGRTARAVSVSLGVAMLVATGVIALATSNGTTAFDAASEANQAQIAKAKGALASVPTSDKAGAEKYTARLNEQLQKAREKGGKVAALQQEFQSILLAENTEQTTGGLASGAAAAAAKHRKELAPYFVDRALIVKDSAAYAPGSVLPFDDDEIDPRFAWHVSYVGTGTTVADPASSRWTLASMVATGTPGVFEATWLDRRTSDGDLLAWASASYYTSQSKFGSVRVGQTTLGATGALNQTTGAN